MLVGDEQAARGVYEDAVGGIEVRFSRGAAIAAIRVPTGPVRSFPRYGRDDSLRVNLTDSVIVNVSDEEITVRVQVDSAGVVQLSLGGRAAVPGEAYSSPSARGCCACR